MGARLTPAGRITLVVLFFSWGLVAVTVRMVVPHFKEAFDLGYRDALLVQSAFFLTYLLFARASGGITARIGLRAGVALGIGLMAVGSIGLAATTLGGNFYALLPSIFVIASGITFLQVAANPLAASQGGFANPSTNLTFAQAFNSLGTVIAPLLAAAAFLDTVTNPLMPVRTLFAGIAIALGLLAMLAWRYLRVESVTAPVAASVRAPWSAFERRRLAAGVGALFLYVGAEVAISTTMLNLLEDEGVIDASRTFGAVLVSIFWMGMLVGRFGALPLLANVGRHIVLGSAAIASGCLCIVAGFAGGYLAALAILVSGLFAGLQFPTIFAIASADLPVEQQSRAAGWLCTGIVGGGLVPLLYGSVADAAGLGTALLVPAACFLAIAWFAFSYGREGLSRRAAG
ncbi:MFS transporter [Paraurantiacibacter namhicola]|uniref:L-fucose-proton symporter n=1 Tax=Paraurantiacibacter namhicola TaxID=645517 RepID=A0A1C7D6W9_9SPHN|nr:MFS transporter [Paraurantiacibacter namhicola]ANU07220.1 L-fucose-proton symporter [Paraurantiacibacter namhicola]